MIGLRRDMKTAGRTVTNGKSGSRNRSRSISRPSVRSLPTSWTTSGSGDTSPRTKRGRALSGRSSTGRQVLGIVETPEGLMIFEIGGDYILGRIRG